MQKRKAGAISRLFAYLIQSRNQDINQKKHLPQSTQRNAEENKMFMI